jgi:hypothetical protein
MSTIVWNISQLDRQTADGFVTTAHWQASAKDGDYSASVYSTCSWQPGTPTIPYDSVTMQEVLDWCWAGGVDKDATEASLLAQIELQKNPVTAAGVPWPAAQ